MVYVMCYRELLPEGCPPNDAILIETELAVFRLVQTDPPSDADFKSYRACNPEKTFLVPECIARGISVFTDKDDCEKAKKLPSLKTRQLCKVNLSRGAGRLKKTGKEPSHHTWWPFAAFNVLENCEVQK